MGQRQTYKSIYKPKQSPNETLGFNQDGHPYKMCNETGIPMVVMVTSCMHSLRKPTQQDFSTHAPYLYINVTHVSNSEEPSIVHYEI